MFVNIGNFVTFFSLKFTVICFSVCITGMGMRFAVEAQPEPQGKNPNRTHGIAAHMPIPGV